jgi:phosphatidylglycerol---prolipoprotein diacylglyceryl transferase
VWEGQADVILFALLLVLKQRRWPKGFLFMFYVITYNLVRFGLEMLRGDSPRFLFHWDAAQTSSMPFLLAGIVVSVILFVRGNRAEHPNHEEN